MGMSDIKLFSVHPEVRQMTSSEVLLEKDLQTLIENNMELFFGVRFLKSEYVITNGRMDRQASALMKITVLLYLSISEAAMRMS